MIRVGIVGTRGIAGETLVRILLGHPEAELALAGSESGAGMPLGEAVPALRDEIDIVCEKPTADALAERCDVVFLATKSPDAMGLVPTLLDAGVKVIDIGAELRFQDPAVYERWYGEHPNPELLAIAEYGLPEIHRGVIREAKLVGNPGCYPTGAILAALPLLEAGLIQAEDMIFDALSGVSGAGRTYSPGGNNLYLSCNENLSVYKTGEHRHTPEIEQALSFVTAKEVTVTFVPHLVPLDRGIQTTLFARPKGNVTTQKLIEAAKRRYEKEPFVRVLDDVNAVCTADVRATNYLDWGAKYVERSSAVVVVTAEDNTVKGASGQAIQNMNIMFGLDETAGLKGRSL